MKNYQFKGWAAKQAKSKLEPYEKIEGNLKSNEVLLRIMASGICHSDIHLIDNDWMISKFPLVPGHEIMGQVVELGSEVKYLDTGDIVGVGWQRGSCGYCEECTTGRDNLCRIDRRTTTADHWGGYGNFHITDSEYAIKIPKGIQKPAVAPLFCGGATVFSPLVEYGKKAILSPVRVGIVGFGGLGHIAVKMARAMGYEVTLFSSSPSKKDEALQMGAHEVVSSLDKNSIDSMKSHFDLVLVTVNVDLAWESYLDTLRSDGTLCFVGVPPSKLSISVDSLLSGQKKVAGSVIGSRGTIDSMLKFCDTHQILPTVEIFEFGKVNEAIDRVRKNEIRYRAVLV